MPSVAETRSHPVHAPGLPSALGHFAVGLAGAIVLIGAWMVLQASGLGKAAFHTKGEPREAIVVQEIVQRGDWILPRRNGIDLPRKPPLFHWLGAIASKAHGEVDEWSVRLPSAVLSGAGALILYGTTSLVLGVRPALLAAFFLLTSFEWLRAATSARVDMTLAFGLTLAFAGLMLFRRDGRRRWLCALYAGIAWATLAKGPVGVALPLLQVATLCLVDRSFDLARRLRPVTGLLIVVGIAGTWYALATLEGGTDFVSTQILDENLYRFVGHARMGESHRHSIAFLTGSLLAGFLPWSVLFPDLGAALWKERRTLSASDPRLFSLLWTLVVFSFHALPASKRGVYLLPLYPSVCLLLGWYSDALLRRQVAAPILSRFLPAFGWTLAATFAVVSVACAAAAFGFSPFDVVAETLGGRARGDAQLVAQIVASRGTVLAVLFAVAALGCILIALNASRRVTTITGLLLATFAVIGGTRQIILPEVANRQTRRTFVSRLKEIVPEPDRLASQRNFDYGVVFYWGDQIPVHEGPLNPSGPEYLLVSENEWSRASPAERRAYERIPGLASGRSGNMGRLVLLRRLTARHQQR